MIKKILLGITFLKLVCCRISQLYKLAKIKLRYPNCNIDSNVSLSVDSFNALVIGDDVSIGAFSEIVVLQKTSYSPIQGGLVIGNRVVIGKGANIRAAGGEVLIEDCALLAQDVSLIAANHSLELSGVYRDQLWDSKRTGVTINKNAWIGAGVVVLPGVVIGENSVIGAGSVVNSNVPPNEIWAGIPAKLIRPLNKQIKK